MGHYEQDRLVYHANLNSYRQAISYVQITPTGTATALTVPTGATSAIITMGGAAATDYIRYTEDGITTPTNAVGMPLFDKDTYEIVGPNCLALFKHIIGAGSPVINITYYK